MNHGKSCAPWPEANVLILRSLWAEGFSASQIAVKMNRPPISAGLTRNAVIAKVHRLGLARRAPSTGARKSRKGLPRRPTGKPSAPRVIAPRLKPDNHRAKGAQVSEHNVRFIDRASNQCPMFLEGEEGAHGLVCGRLAADGRWCVSCRALVYRPTLARRAA